MPQKPAPPSPAECVALRAGRRRRQSTPSSARLVVGLGTRDVRCQAVIRLSSEVHTRADRILRPVHYACSGHEVMPADSPARNKPLSEVFAEPNEAVGFGVTCTWRICRRA